jgi:uncharacterized protein YjiK
MFSIKKKIIYLAGIFGLYLIGCNGIGKKKRFPDTDRYDLSSPTVIKLPEILDEISGIAYYPKDTSVFAIVDEDGFLFKIPIKNPAASIMWRFDKSRDYEDLVLIDSTFYVLVSNGDIVTVKFNGNQIHAEKSEFSETSKKANEFESLYQDSDSGNLIMMCKECEEDSKKTITSYSYGYRDSVKSYHNYMLMDAVPIAEKLGMSKVHLKASAAAINPVTEELYILSAVNNILVITNKKGALKAVYKLDPGLYKQPEGIAFTPTGDMIISTERAEVGFATLLVLKNKLKGK